MLRQDVPLKATLCRRAAMQKLPISGSFELTPRCSLNCKMCYIRMTKEQMRPLGEERTAQQWLDLAQQAKDAGMVFLLLTGGEPLVCADFCDLYTELSRLGLSIDINTNGTLIDERMAAFFHNCPPAKINLTLYGASSATYARLCGDDTAYERVVHAIDALREAGLLVSLNATLTPENIQDTAAIVDFAKSRGLYLKLTSLVVPPYRRGVREDAHRLSAEQAGKAAAQGHFRYFGREETVRKLQQLQKNPDFSLLDDCVRTAPTGTGCLAGTAQFWAAWNGEMYPCCMMPWIRANPFETGFDAAWKQITAVCAKIVQTPQCVGCALSAACPSCAALQHCETGGKPLQRPEYLCRMTEAYRNELATLLEQQKRD